MHGDKPHLRQEARKEEPPKVHRVERAADALEELRNVEGLLRPFEGRFVYVFDRHENGTCVDDYQDDIAAANTKHVDLVRNEAAAQETKCGKSTKPTR